MTIDIIHRRVITFVAVTATVGIPLAGCGKRPAPSRPTTSRTTSDVTTSSAELPSPLTDDPVDDTSEDATPGPDAVAVVETTEASTTTDKPRVVTLGVSDLTSGIPGGGPLTVEDIQAWLDRPENHRVLDVKLPMGLDKGQSAIKGLDKNPLTLAKIELGRQLYFDGRLSADGSVSCADCHHPDEGYARHTQFGVGIEGQTGGRNSPVSYNRILSDAQFWDGRAESLEAQAVGPIANPIEMGNTHEAAVKTLAGIEGYKIQFEKIFSDGVTIDNVGKAIASFERTIVTGPSPFDYYEDLQTIKRGFADLIDDLDAFKEEEPEAFERYQNALAMSEKHPMSESAARGRELFFGQKGGCTACHVGPNLADEKYHNLGVGLDAEEPDLGRFVVTKVEKDKGAFKTPTIRNVALSAPYMHDGSQKTLAEVVDWYDKGGHPNPQLSDGIRKLNLTPEEKGDLVAFMEACTGEFPNVERERLPE